MIRSHDHAHFGQGESAHQAGHPSVTRWLRVDHAMVYVLVTCWSPRCKFPDGFRKRFHLRASLRHLVAARSRSDQAAELLVARQPPAVGDAHVDLVATRGSHLGLGLELRLGLGLGPGLGIGLGIGLGVRVRGRVGVKVGFRVGFRVRCRAGVTVGVRVWD